MDVRHLELLRDLADRGSVTAVATATHRTPSAVSQQLRSAAAEFGVPLVERSGRGIVLTDAGRLLAEGAREVDDAVARVQARWDAFRGEAVGVVRVAALPSAATVLLPSTLRALEGSGIEILATDVDRAEAEYPELVRDHDIVIGHSLSARFAARRGDLRVVPLAREPLDIALRAGHRLADRDVVTAAEVVGEEWYGVPIGFPFDSVRLAVEEATQRPVRVVQRLRDNRLIEALVADSDRVAVLPRFTTPTGDRMVLRPLADVAIQRHVLAYLRPDRAERVVVRRVLELLREAGAVAEGGSREYGPVRG